MVAPERKFELLFRLLEREQPTRAIVFCRTKRGADRVGNLLRGEGVRADTMHGDLSQAQRNRVLAGVPLGRLTTLVATDVVGRGIDVRGVSHVINFDLPEDPDALRPPDRPDRPDGQGRRRRSRSSCPTRARSSTRSRRRSPAASIRTRSRASPASTARWVPRSEGRRAARSRAVAAVAACRPRRRVAARVPRSAAEAASAASGPARPSGPSERVPPLTCHETRRDRPPDGRGGVSSRRGPFLPLPRRPPVISDALGPGSRRRAGGGGPLHQGLEVQLGRGRRVGLEDLGHLLEGVVVLLLGVRRHAVARDDQAEIAHVGVVGREQHADVAGDPGAGSAS